MSTAKAMLVGALAGLVAVGIVVVLLVAKVVPLGDDSVDAVDEAVAVGLVLPDAASGTTALRVLDIYEKRGADWTIRSVSPSTTVVVPGTGGSTLADAYTFGGGKGLTDVLQSKAEYSAMSWVIVDEAAWKRLRGSASIDVTLTSGIEVFDGARLYSFERGPISIPGSQTAQLFDGVSFGEGADAAAIRVAVGDALASSLASAGPSAAEFVESGLQNRVLSEWLGTLGVPRRIEVK